MTGRLHIEEVFDVVCVALAMIICRHGFWTGFIGRMGALIDILFSRQKLHVFAARQIARDLLGGNRKAFSDFFRSSFDNCRCQQVQPAELIVVSPEAPS